jgi:thiol-disulfide isomerase/thioredoxin
MFRMLLLILSLTLSVNLNAEEKPPAATAQQSIQGKVELFFFWSHFCPHCLDAKPFVENLARRYNWLTLHSYDIINNDDNVNRYISMAQQLNVTPNGVPGFIFCGQIQLGFNSVETSGKNLEHKLVACHESQQQTKPKINQESIEIPLLGTLNYQDFSLPVFTVIIAGLDAFNPCAFFVLCFLLSLIVHSRDRWRIATIGGTFVLFSGLLYFLFMTAWLNLFLFTQEIRFITAVAGLIAVIIGMINVKDYFFFKQGFSLSIPESAKPKLFQRMRLITQTAKLPMMLAATAVLAIAANSYELLCTAGFPMVYTRVLTLNALSSQQYYLYLALYNLIYVLPLLIIVAIFTWTLGNKKISEREGRLLKLLSGNMMLGLGSLLLFAPHWLNNMLTSVLVMVVALVVTWASAQARINFKA